MRFSTSTWTILALPTAAMAVSLADFGPLPKGLPSSCLAVCTKNIEACAPSDFTRRPSKCSKRCVNALYALTTQVESACGNKGITGQNDIVAYLAGQGPQSLCSNADDFLPAPQGYNGASTSATTPTETSSSHVATSASSRSSVGTSTTAEHSTTATLSGTTTASTAVSIDSSDSSSQLTASSTTSRGSSHTDTSGSGGGSPFDTQGDSGSAGTTLAVPFVTTILALLVFGAIRR